MIVKCLKCGEIFGKEGFLHKSHLETCKLKSLPKFPANYSLEGSIQIDIDDDEVRDDQEIVLSSDDDDETGSNKPRDDFLRDETKLKSAPNTKTQAKVNRAKVAETQTESQEIIKLDDEETFDEMFGIAREDQSDMFSQIDLTIKTAKRSLSLSSEDYFRDDSKTRKSNDESDIPDEPQNQHGVQARDQTQEPELKYFYFCLDCESHLSENCRHMTHPRVPIGIDIAEHFASRGHSRLQTIGEFVIPIKERRLLTLQNVSFSKTWSSRVRKCWKKMVLSGDKTTVEFDILCAF